MCVQSPRCIDKLLCPVAGEGQITLVYQLIINGVRLKRVGKKRGHFYFGGGGGSEMVSDELRIVTVVARRLPSLPFQPVNSGFF